MPLYAVLHYIYLRCRVLRNKLICNFANYYNHDGKTRFNIANSVSVYRNFVYSPPSIKCTNLVAGKSRHYGLDLNKKNNIYGNIHAHYRTSAEEAFN